MARGCGPLRPASRRDPVRQARGAFEGSSVRALIQLHGAPPLRRSGAPPSPVCLPEAGTRPGTVGDSRGSGTKIEVLVLTAETTEGRGLSLS